jgi:hypothetical protein
MRLTLILIVSATVLSASASASLIEDQTGVHYQADGGVDRDAPDTCPLLDPERILAIGGNSTKGIMVPGDDVSDFYNTPTGADLVGQRVYVRIRAADGNLAGLDIDVQLPGCNGSVFDPETWDEQAAMLNSDPKYSQTEEPAVGEKTVAAHKLTGYACDPNEWHFLINQIAGAPAPDHIRVTWSNGDIENVPIVKTTPATVVHYRTTSNLDQPVWAASVNIFAAWSGQFNLGSGPCNGAATPPPEPFVPPIDNGQSGYFTVVSALPYGTQARLEEVAQPPAGTKSCHEFCGGALEAMGTGFGYDLFSSLAPSS